MMVIQAMQAEAKGQMIGARLAYEITAGVARQYVDPVSRAIVAASRLRYSLEISMACLTRLRYSDLHKVRLGLYLNGFPVSVVQEKTRREVPVISTLPLGWANSAGLDLTEQPELFTYDTAYYGIRLAMKDAGIRGWPGSKDAMHIFRHLWATWAWESDVPVKTISTVLGHVDGNSVKAYIHAEGLGTALKER